MRILVLSSFYPPHHLGGYEVLCEAAVRGMRERGHEVRVLTSRYRRDGAGGDGDADRSLHLFWDDGEWQRPGLAGAIRRTRDDLGVLDQELAGFGPDVVWAWHMAAVSKSLLSACVARGLPVVLSILDAWPIYDMAPDPWLRWTRGWRAPVGRPLGLAARLPVRPLRLGDLAGASYCSAWMRDVVVGAGAAPTGPVIHPGVDPSFLEAFREASRPVRKFLVVGRVEPRKGPAVAVEALSRIRSAGIDDATLAIHGFSERGHRSELEALARRLGVGDAVTFGQSASRAELPGVYAAHDAVVHAATWEEPFGLVLLEAMACGRPVIASPTGGAKEIVTDDNALTFPPGNVEACAKRMWQLASDPSLAARLSEAGRQTAARFSEDEAVRAHEEQLRSVVER